MDADIGADVDVESAGVEQFPQQIPNRAFPLSVFDEMQSHEGFAAVEVQSMTIDGMHEYAATFGPMNGRAKMKLVEFNINIMAQLRHYALSKIFAKQAFAGQRFLQFGDDFSDNSAREVFARLALARQGIVQLSGQCSAQAIGKIEIQGNLPETRAVQE
ncbi:MAG: hypothetical protein WAL33_06805 [Caulobacter sp.]